MWDWIDWNTISPAKEIFNLSESFWIKAWQLEQLNSDSGLLTLDRWEITCQPACEYYNMLFVQIPL